MYKLLPQKMENPPQAFFNTFLYTDPFHQTLLILKPAYQTNVYKFTWCFNFYERIFIRFCGSKKEENMTNKNHCIIHIFSSNFNKKLDVLFHRSKILECTCLKYKKILLLPLLLHFYLKRNGNRSCEKVYNTFLLHRSIIRFLYKFTCDHIHYAL